MLQNEQAKDKADWEKYQAQQTGGFQWNELTNLPNLSQILTTLMQVIHAHEQQNAQTNQQERNMYKGGERRRGPGGHQRPHGQHHGGFNQNQGQHMQGGAPMGQMNQQQMMQMQGMGGGMPQPPQPAGMPQGRMPGQPMPPQMLPHGGPVGMPPQPGMPAPPAAQGQMMGGVKGAYMASAQKILPAIVERNPNYSEQAGQVIYDYIEKLVGPETAPKITGMLIELPIHQIRAYLSSYDALVAKVNEAREHLDNAEKK